ncbi:hypothetical protein HY631_04660 [Candidatus Uhrbacteria bacterium]|nr:hypothetical protein [Candidatus Uhrbacteria bacterium]
MKIWNSYGSEHSANLVIIGTFKDTERAADAIRVLDRFSEVVPNQSPVAAGSYYSNEVLALLQECRVSLAPKEIEDFVYEHHWRQDGKRIVITTEESEYSALINTMLSRGAKVEVFSAHQHDTPYGRSTRNS